MFRAVNDYLARLDIKTDDDVLSAMSSFLGAKKSIQNYSINTSFNRYIVDIKIKKYSISNADKLFRSFVSAVAYPYSCISVRYNEDSRVRYRFATCKEDKTGVYMDVIISQS